LIFDNGYLDIDPKDSCWSSYLGAALPTRTTLGYSASNLNMSSKTTTRSTVQQGGGGGGGPKGSKGNQRPQSSAKDQTRIK